MNPSERSHFVDLPDLESQVFSLVSQVPAGAVTTYGDLARALGDEKTSAARWIGGLLKNHQCDSKCNCHRVVRSNGELGHYVSGVVDEKRQLLVQEGVEVSEHGTVVTSGRFANFESAQPLRELKKRQLQLVDGYQRRSLERPPVTLAGVDCAYPERGRAVGAYVELDAKTLEVTYRKQIRVAVHFPYIPGYLTFRELLVLLKLIDEVQQERRLADVIFVDGNGLLHPWRTGIATCLGILIDHPTLGLGKSLLCGSVEVGKVRHDAPQKVMHNGEVIGAAITSPKETKPVFVSSGQHLSLEDALHCALRAFDGHRVPEPIFFADKLTKQD